MKYLYKYFLLILILPLILFSSCRKHIENKLEGKWKRVIVEDINSKFVETWQFKSDKSIIIHRDADANNGWVADANVQGNYMVNSRLKRDYFYLYIDTTNIKSYDGVWEIVYVKKKTLMVVKRPEYQSFFNQGHRERNSDRQGTVLFREFVRAD